MYGWLWRHLPGPVAVRLVICLGLLGLVVVLLFGWVFPWIQPRLPFTDVTVDSSTGAARTSSTGLSTVWGGITGL